MSWDVVHSQRLVKDGELPTRYLRVATKYLRVATILKETSHEFLRHLMSLHDIPTRILVFQRLISYSKDVV